MKTTHKLPFELKKMYTVEMPEKKDIDHLKNDLFDILSDWIAGEVGKEVVFSVKEYSEFDGFWDKIGTEWVVTTGEMQGTLPKRISKIFAKYSDTKIPEHIATKIGNIAGKFYATTGKLYYLDFVDEFNWKDGRFGDSGSCFWGGRSDARSIMEQSGVLALRFFNDENRKLLNGVARSWLYPVFDNCVVLFNGYGIELQQQAQILCTLMGAKKKKINLSNKGETNGTVFINNGSAFLIGQPDLLKQFNGIDLDLQME